MKDVIGKELKVGNKVAFVRNLYKNLGIGTITKITNDMIFINYGENLWQNVKKFPTSVIKIEE